MACTKHVQKGVLHSKCENRDPYIVILAKIHFVFPLPCPKSSFLLHKHLQTSSQTALVWIRLIGK